MDLAATLLELGDATYPEYHNGKQILPLAGRSLLPVFSDEPSMERAIFFEHEGNRAVRKGKWKIVWTNFDRRWHLYQIDSDRSELNDLAKVFSDKVKELEEEWLDWAQTHFVELEKVAQPATGMPKVYYLPDQTK
jgi:arylsulfatase